MYIQPNTTVHLLSGIRLDPDEKHTINWENATNQQNYFISKKKKSYDQASYARLSVGVIRVQSTADALFDCNYMMYKNISHGDKWFYAYITEVEYINDNNTAIHFKIDELQTWYFEKNIETCFVEREHSVTDNPGDNLMDEPFDVGEYKSDNWNLVGAGLIDLWKICVACAYDTNFQVANGAPYATLYTGLKYNVFATATEANAFLTELTRRNMQDSVVAVYMIPAKFDPGEPSGITGAPLIKVDVPVSRPSITDFDYQFKNKKMFTYPYSFLTVENAQGRQAIYKWELFDHNTCHFEQSGDISPDGEMILAPKDYAGVNDANYSERFSVGGFPLCAYHIDAYKAYLAQNKYSIGIQGALAVGGGVVGGIGSLVTGNALGAIGSGAGAISGVGSIMSGIAKASTQPEQMHGTQSGATVFGLGLFNFKYYHKYVHPTYAKAIDEFFTVYGYMTKRLKVPNTNSRPHWNYVQTKDSVVTGAIPADAKINIQKRLDNGVTFWTSGDEIGNYSLDNSPT